MENGWNSNIVTYFKECANGENGIYFIQNTDGEYEYISYKEMYQIALKKLGLLQKNGAGIQTELLILTESEKEFMGYFWGALLGRIIAVPVKTSEKEEDCLRVARIIEKMKNPLILVDKARYQFLSAFAEKNSLSVMSEVLRKHTIITEEADWMNCQGQEEEQQPEDIAIIQYSSGSTGSPKGVILTQKNLVSGVNDIIESSKIDENDVYMSWLPLTHNMGLIGLHLTPVLRHGMQIFMSPLLFMKKPTLWLEVISKFRVSRIAGPNFAYRVLCDICSKKKLSGIDLSCVRTVYNGSEPVSMELVRTINETLAPYGFPKTAMYPVYGMAEATLAITFPIAFTEPRGILVDRKKLQIGDKGTCLQDPKEENATEFAILGYTLRHCDLKILDENNKELEDGHIGIIHLRGDNITQGYYQQEVNAWNEEGWFNTGDVGFLIDGQLVITGRQKEIILVCGQNFYPSDVERICASDLSISQEGIVAVGCYNKESCLEELVIFVQNQKVEEEKEVLEQRIRNNIWSKLGIPSPKIIWVDEIPKSVGGKVARYKLNENYTNGLYEKKVEENESDSNEPKTTEEVILQEAKQLLGIQNLEATTSLSDVGITSILAIKFYQKLNTIYPGILDLATLFSLPTIQEIAKYIDTELRKKAEFKGCKLKKEYDMTSEKYVHAVEELNIEVGKDVKQAADENGLSVQEIAYCYIIRSLSELTEDGIVNVYVEQDKRNLQLMEFATETLTSVSSIVQSFVNQKKHNKIFNINEIEKSTVQDGVCNILLYDCQEVVPMNKLQSFQTVVGVKGKSSLITLCYSSVSQQLLIKLSQYINQLCTDN